LYTAWPNAAPQPLTASHSPSGVIQQQTKQVLCPKPDPGSTGKVLAQRVLATHPLRAVAG